MGSAAAPEDDGAMAEAFKRKASLSCHYQMERKRWFVLLTRVLVWAPAAELFGGQGRSRRSLGLPPAV